MSRAKDIKKHKGPENLSCIFCAFTTQRKNKMDKHLLTLKHKMLAEKDEKRQKSTESPEKISGGFHCEKCDFITQAKSKWEMHLLTLKHKNAPKGTDKLECTYCNHLYSSLKGLKAHHTKCPERMTELSLIEQNTELMRKNQELTDKIVEICSNMKPSIITNNNITNNTNTNNTNTNNNKTFNLNFFLNETCKNAMSLQDFVNSIQLQLSDLEETGRIGFSGGISNIITNSLNKLETENKPMHCTDSKRETIYIKNDTEWQKDENKEQLTTAIKQIARKNSQNILPWRELNPDCCNSSSRKNDQYLKIVGNAMAGGDQAEIKRNIDKIVSNIAKQIVVDK